MKVAFIYGAYPPIPDGGAGFLKNLAHNLVKMGVEVSVITTSKIASSYNSIHSEGLNILPVINDWKLNLQNFKQLRKVLKETRPDIVHTIFPCATFGNDYQIPMLIKLACSKPLVTTLYGFSFLSGNFRMRLAILTLLHCSDRLLSDNDFVIGIINKYLRYLRKKICYIPSGSNIPNDIVKNLTKETLRQQYSISPNSFYICYFGYIDWTRGLENLFYAVKIVSERGYDVKVVMIGGNPFKSNKKYFEDLSILISELKLESQVIWTGFCDEEQVAHYFICSDICVLPFRRNTTGRSSLAAALSFGLPLITTSYNKELFSLRDHENVILVPPDNTYSLANAIIELINDPKLRFEMGQAAYNLWKSHFAWDVIAKNTLKIYEEVMNE